MKTFELEADSILKSYNEVNVLTDIYLKCTTGEVVGLLGRNGSGKSTLLKIIFGALETDNKSIRINKKTYQYPFKEKDLIAYMPQANFLPENVPLNKLINLYVSNKEAQERIRKVEVIKKHLSSTCYDLSGGERRLFELLLLINLPVKFILLDEPFAAIEPLYKEMIKELINEFKEEKGFIVTDHDYRNIIDVSDRINLMTNGVCKSIDNLDQLEEYNYLPKGTLSAKNTTDNYVEENLNSVFEVDEQTLKDLELNDFGHPDSLLSIFEGDLSKGGQSKLLQMLEHPITNGTLLEGRRDTIRYIQVNNLDFNFERKHIDFIEYYQHSGIVISRTNYVDSFFNGLKNKYKITNDFYVVKTGVEQTIRFLEEIIGLVENFKNKDIPLYLSKLIFRIQDIVTQGEIRKVLHNAELKDVLYRQGQLDFLFRKAMKDDMLLLLGLYSELEAYQIVANTATKFGFCYPEYLSGVEPTIEIKGLFHPKLSNAVANDFNIKYASNVCFLTGANMSGKSTFLKSFGITMYFAHLGFPIPATSLRTTVLNGLITTINLSDNINNGYSHFYSEVKRVKEAALAVRNRKNMIVIFDELFRGTNVKDASDASLLITSAFSKIPHSLFLVSTHIVEIADQLKKNDNVFYSCFETTLENEVPLYNYKLKQGISKESLGFIIVKNEGIVEILEGT